MPIFDNFSRTDYPIAMQSEFPSQMDHSHTVANNAAAGAAPRVLR